MTSRLQRILHRTAGLAFSVVAVLLFIWSIGAVWYLRDTTGLLTSVVAAVYAAVGLCYLVRDGVRQWRVAILLPVLLVHMLTWSAQPRLQRDWAADNLYQSTVRIDDAGAVLVPQFRQTRYDNHGRPTVQYRPLRFHLHDLQRVWFVVHRFSRLESIAHNFLTFEIRDGEQPHYLTVSVEVRRQQGEQFSPIRGLYQQYELIYVFADERDQIGARTVLRPTDRTWLFEVNARPDEVRHLFRDIADRANRLAIEPEFYHSLTNNCTNNLVVHTYGLTPSPLNWLDPRVILPGLADRLAYARGLIGRPGQSFDALQDQSRIDQKAARHGLRAGFSNALRTPGETD